VQTTPFFEADPVVLVTTADSTKKKKKHFEESAKRQNLEVLKSRL
jgi:hypothetical protein